MNVEDGNQMMKAGERFMSVDETTGMSINLCVKCSDRKKEGLCPCKLYADKIKIVERKDIEKKGGKVVDVIDVRGVFEQLERQKEPMRHLRSERCPHNCRARAINLRDDGGCNPENCIKLSHKAKALTALSLTTGVDEKPKKHRLMRYNRRDKKLLVEFTSWNKVTSGPKYRFIERDIVKQQAKEMGFKLPPMRTGERAAVRSGLPLPPRHLTVSEIARAREQLKRIGAKAQEIHIAKPLPPRLGICQLHIAKLRKDAKRELMQKHNLPPREAEKVVKAVESTAKLLAKRTIEDSDKQVHMPKKQKKRVKAKREPVTFFSRVKTPKRVKVTFYKRIAPKKNTKEVEKHVHKKRSKENAKR